MLNDPLAHDALIERYLDGDLSPGELEAFEKRCAADESLRAQVELQDRVDESLRRLFAPGSAAALAQPIQITRARTGPPWRYLAYAAAAAMLLAAPASLIIFSSSGPPSDGSLLQVERATLRGVYQSTVGSGFEPVEVCTTPEAFETWVGERYRFPLRPAADDPGVRFVGWSYSTVISNYTGLLLARVDDQPVIVALDRAELERYETREGEGPQNIFQRRIGDLVLYEVTPLDRPRILPLLSPGS